MKILKSALVAAFALVSTTASAGLVQTQPSAGTADVSTCYYRYTVRTLTADYHYYRCYNNFDGTA